jgi:uncharacterized protein (TIGR02265 family)
MSERLVPASLVKELIEGNNIQQTPSYIEILKEEYHYDYNQPYLNIAIETYLAVIDFVRRTCYPDKTIAEGYFWCGYNSIEGHFQGPVGKINRIALRMFSFEKLTELYLKTQHFNYPWGKHEYEELRKDYLRYHRRGVPTPPDYTRGVLSYLMGKISGKEVEIIATVLEPEDVIYEIRW